MEGGVGTAGVGVGKVVTGVVGKEGGGAMGVGECERGQEELEKTRKCWGSGISFSSRRNTGNTTEGRRSSGTGLVAVEVKASGAGKAASNPTRQLPFVTPLHILKKFPFLSSHFISF